MVERFGFALGLRSHIHPLALLLAAMFALPTWFYYGWLITVPLSAVYFLMINYVLQVNLITVRTSSEISDPFLLSFSKALASSSPEEAFLSAYECSSPSSKIMHGIVDKIRNGGDLIAALKSANASSREDEVLLFIIADLLSFSREEAAKRISLYVDYLQEKKKLRSEMAMKMSVLALRFRILSVVGSASLAVIAFTSPLLSALSGISGGIYEEETQSWLRFNPFVFFSLLSLLIASSYLFSKMMNGVDGKKVAALSAVIFIVVDLLLIATIGGRV